MSKNKQMFVEYCKDKIIDDVGDVIIKLAGNDYKAMPLFKTPVIRDSKDCTVYSAEDFGDDLIWIDGQEKVFATLMSTAPILLIECVVKAKDLTAIYKSFYENILTYWEDLNMDEIIDDLKEEDAE